MNATLLSETRPKRAIHFALLAGLCLVTWLTYRPSLWHTARDDQWPFLNETRNDDGHWKRLVRREYAYNRTTDIARGDYPLFRPVLYTLLVTEKALLGHRFFWWQAVGIAVHCAVVWLLLTLMLRLDRLGAPGERSGMRFRTAVAYGLALFFAVDFAVMELVIYHHLTAYMVFLLFELGVMVLVLDQLADANSSRRVRLLRIGGTFVLALLAAFTYEIGQYFAVVVGLVLGAAAWHRGRRRQGAALVALFCLVLVLFQLADRSDRLIHPPWSSDIDEFKVLVAAWTPTTLINAGRYLAFCLVQPFFPSCVDLGFMSRLHVPEPSVIPANYVRPDPLLLISGLVVIGVVSLSAYHLRRLLSDPKRATRLVLAFLAFTLLMLHMTIVVLGRMNMRPRLNILSDNSYYAYLPLSMLLVGLYALWSSRPAVGQAKSERLAGGLQLAVVVGLMVLSAASACKVYAMNAEIKNIHRPLRAWVALLDGVVHEHQRDARFTLSFSPDVWARFEDLHQMYRLPRSFPVILYSRYLDQKNPTHVLALREGRWHAYPVDEYDRLYPGPGKR